MRWHVVTINQRPPDCPGSRRELGDTGTNFHGTQYIDEIVATRDKDKGQLFVHQDRTWNVIGKTDLSGNVVERYTYDPYGQ
jgi:hypothetical protein